MHPFILYANEVTKDRERQLKHLAVIDEERFALRQSAALAEPRSWHIRRSIARGLAATSRATATVVRRLDDCVADDLGRSLAPTE